MERKLTGTFNSQILGEVALKGTVKGNAIEFGFEGDAGGQTLKVSYKGTIESPTAMKGTAVYAGFEDNATWTATEEVIRRTLVQSWHSFFTT